MNGLPQLPHLISPGLYPPIRDLVRQCGQVTVYPFGLVFMLRLPWAAARLRNYRTSPGSLVCNDRKLAVLSNFTLASERESLDRRRARSGSSCSCTHCLMGR